MQYQVAHSHGKDQRVAPRTDVYARVALTLPDGVQTMVTIVNISADGAAMGTSIKRLAHRASPPR